MESWILAYEHPLVKPIGFFTHSLVIAALGFAAVYYLKRDWYPYIYGWLFRIFTDVLTHVSDAQPVLWPLSARVFPGPISYWERAHYGLEFTIVNLVLASLFALYLSSTKNRLMLQNHPKGQVALFGLLSVYVLGTGVLMSRIGLASPITMLIHSISGILFFLVAGKAYNFNRKQP